jgi:hypothetical protein
MSVHARKKIILPPSVKAQVFHVLLPILGDPKVQNSDANKQNSERNGHVVEAFFNATLGAKDVAFTTEC